MWLSPETARKKSHLRTCCGFRHPQPSLATTLGHAWQRFGLIQARFRATSRSSQPVRRLIAHLGSLIGLRNRNDTHSRRCLSIRPGNLEKTPGNLSIGEELRAGSSIAPVVRRESCETVAERHCIGPPHKPRACGAGGSGDRLFPLFPFPSPFVFRIFGESPMKSFVVALMAGALMMIAGSAYAGCGCEPACGYEPTCCAQPVCCKKERCHKHRCHKVRCCKPACEPSCGAPACAAPACAAPAPTCAAPVAPTCGVEPTCAAAPSCGCEPKCGCEKSCCKKQRCHKVRCCKQRCPKVRCCKPVCCKPAPVCCNPAPTCGCGY